MEHFSQSFQKNKKRECFLTEVPKEEPRVHFEEDGTITPTHCIQLSESVPIPINHMGTSKTEIKSAEGKRSRTFGMGRLKNLLKQNKQGTSRKITSKEVPKQITINELSQNTNKYFRISINVEDLKQSISNSQRTNSKVYSKLDQKPSMNTFLQQRTQTETLKQDDYKSFLKDNTKDLKRLPKRRKCRITTQQQFEEECTKYIESREKDETNELFRELNREMKLNQKRKEPNNYYQKIRRSALKKIDYMSYNQKYYDDQQVKHLFSVVDNCNILIHKRSQNENQRNYKRLQTQRSCNLNTCETKLFTERANTEEDLNRTSISNSNEKGTKGSMEKVKQVYNKYGASKTVKMSHKDKARMSKKITDLVNVCEKERRMLQEVKTGMRVFEFYCSKIDSGLAIKGKRLNNFILGEEDS